MGGLDGLFKPPDAPSSSGRRQGLDGGGRPPQQRPPSSPSHAHTHHAGEEASRLASAARYLGLSTAMARAPAQPVRSGAPARAYEPDHDRSGSRGAAAALRAMKREGKAVLRGVGLLFSDTTLAAARMHSVGVTAAEERIAEDGTLHLMSVARRRRGEKVTPEYEDLADLFKRPGVMAAEKPLEVEVHPVEGEEELEEVVLDAVEGGSLVAAVFGIVKGTVGPAILYLPRGFRMAGWGAAIPCMIVSTASFLYSANRLLECWSEESKRDHLRGAKLEEIRGLLEGGAPEEGGYGATVEDRDSPAGGPTRKKEDEDFTPRLLSYPELARRAFSGVVTSFVTLGIALMQFGVCLTYLIFVPQNLTESTRELFGTYVPETYFLVGMVLMEIPLSWIRDIRRLTPLNVLATLLIAYGLASCLILAFGAGRRSAEEGGPGIVGKVAGLDALNDTWYLFIGTSFFVFEGSITLLVPLQEAVYAPEDRAKFPSVNRRVTTYIVVFYIFFAVTCWAAFGDAVRTALTASLSPGAFATSVQFAYSIAVIFTFPLQAFPALEVACHTTEQKAGAPDSHLTSIIRNRDLMASVIVCLLGVVAYLSIDYLGNVVSLLGSLVGVPIALIFPPLMHNRLVRDSTRGRRFANSAVAGLGVLAMMAASFTTVVSWDKGAE